MKLISILSVAVAAALLLAWKETESTESTDSASAAEVERGKYLVHDVALCVQCHSPRDGKGQLKADRLLSGGQIPFKTPWKARWAELAPNLKQLLGYTDEQAMTLLTKGFKRNGEAPRGPMPPFRMKDEDAKAVIAYLRSL